MIASMHVLDIIVIALGALILFLLLYIVAAVNSFKRLLVKIANDDDKVEECLKNRYDLFKTLKITQDNSFDALDFKNMTIEQKIEINRKLNSISENLIKIQLDSLKENESQLQAAILEYNSQVEKFNHRLTVFPASLIANLIRLKPIKYFEN